MTSSDWVSLREAAQILGVHPATVRNWADRGELPFRRTSGGHRRFKRSDLLRQAQPAEEVKPIEAQVIIQNALGQARMRIEDGDLQQAPWYTSMSDATHAALRQQGRAVLDAIRTYLANGATDDELSVAISLGEAYAEILQKDGLTLTQAVRGFLYFSDFVPNAVFLWSEVTQPRDPAEWVNLLRQVNTFINTMLLSLIEYFDAD